MEPVAMEKVAEGKMYDQKLIEKCMFLLRIWYMSKSVERMIHHKEKPHVITANTGSISESTSKDPVRKFISGTVWIFNNMIVMIDVGASPMKKVGASFEAGSLL